jgi:preprotein translocase subunit SecF
MLVVSYFYQIEVIYQIAAVLFFGLVGDLISTWLMNAPVLLWYIESKGGKV